LRVLERGVTRRVEGIGGKEYNTAMPDDYVRRAEP